MNGAICSSRRDEPASRPEWLEHQRRLGVDHFSTFDDGSATPSAAG